MSLSNKTILVTGGCGMIGSVIVKLLLKRGAYVKALDNLSAYPFDQIEVFDVPDAVDVIEGDIEDKECVTAALEDVDAVIHAAAFADVAAAVKYHREDFRTNVSGTYNVLSRCLEADVDKFVFVSSASVYGNGTGSGVFSEDQPCVPISTYANSKLWGENESLLFHELYGLKTTALRYFSVYGVPQIPKEGSQSWCVAIFSMRALKDRSIQIFGDGQQVRDFVHVDDIAEGTLRALESDKAVGRAINIGTGISTSVLKIAQLVRKKMGEVDLEFLERRAGDPRGGCADTIAMKKVLDWEPVISLEEGIQSYCEWVRRHRENTPEWI